MTDNRANDIILELKKNFYDDKQLIQNRIAEIESQITEDKEYIDSLSSKDDTDYNMFSPRSASKIYKDQIFEKKAHIEELEEEIKQYYKKLSDITKRLDSITLLQSDSLEDKAPSEEKSESVSFAENKINHDTTCLTFQERDRQRIAADLHDGVLQNLTLVMHNLDLAIKFMDYDSVRAKLEMETNRKLVKETIDEIRSTIFDLRPMQFDDFGFEKSLENQIEHYSSRTDMAINYHIDNIEHVSHVLQLTVFRICQELIINAIKHSQGQNLSVSVYSGSQNIIIEVVDDGIGLTDSSFNKENHYGLQIVKERVAIVNGSISFPQTDKGTKVIIDIPLKDGND
jgi:two-component system sensor histidine kinase DegS